MTEEETLFQAIKQAHSKAKGDNKHQQFKDALRTLLPLPLRPLYSKTEENSYEVYFHYNRKTYYAAYDPYNGELKKVKLKRQIHPRKNYQAIFIDEIEPKESTTDSDKLIITEV
jgi:hypothetical protein